MSGTSEYSSARNARLVIEPTVPADRAVCVWAHGDDDRAVAVWLSPMSLRVLSADLAERADLIAPAAPPAPTTPETGA